MNNVINLEDYLEYEEKYTFIKAFATNTRLMGVIGIKMHYLSENNEELILVFNLDFEEYGFNRFEVIKSNNKKFLNKILGSFVGGLGGVFEEISLKNASSLIYLAIKVGEKYLNDIPVNFYEYEYLLEDYCEDITENLANIISTKIKTDEELINYYLIRTIAMDYKIRDLMLSEIPIKYYLVEEPTVLLKNEIFKENDYYISKSIIDYNDSYKMIISKIKIKENKIIFCKKIDQMIMTAIEASFQLNKKEYLAIFYMENAIEFKMVMEEKKYGLLKNIYENGSLYTEFKKTNNHVNSKIYYLNEDVYATYYVTDKNHLVISCFDKRNLNKIRKELLEAYININEIAELEADIPILYNFVNSRYLDFFEFLGE